MNLVSTTGLGPKIYPNGYLGLSELFPRQETGSVEWLAWRRWPGITTWEILGHRAIFECWARLKTTVKADRIVEVLTLAREIIICLIITCFEFDRRQGSSFLWGYK
jgi:hypothetical protein